MATQADESVETATLGAGCFWCVEAVFQQLEGVLSARSGYMGGTKLDPTYREVCTGETGHAEVVQVRFDPARLAYEHLLAWFFKLHDPTTLDRQGNDVGTQYRSAIFTHSEQQERVARAAVEALDASGTHAQPVVTQIRPATAFYPAEADHDDYYRENRGAAYCQLVIAPKLENLGLQA
jgi:peptide-methionine (S)-S-oxide reductase